MDSAYDVIVVGAGASGLTAAYELNRSTPKCKLIVLEAQGGYLRAFYNKNNLYSSRFLLRDTVD